MIAAPLHRKTAQPPRWDNEQRNWVITRYADAAYLLKSKDIAVVEAAKELQKFSDRMGGAFPNMILLLDSSHPFQNPPAHPPIREALKDFIGDISCRWPPAKIGELIASLLASTQEGQGFDAMQVLARSIPATILADALGLDLREVFGCSDLTRSLASIWHHDAYNLRNLRQKEEIATELVQRLSDSVGMARRPDYAWIAFLTMAGIDTTVGLLANAIHVLATQPALQERLRAEPGLTNEFISEVLRYWPPLRRIIGRKATKDLTVSGTTIPSGAFVAIDLESVNHDPEAYDEPDRFELGRKGPPTLAFGAGAHTCLGLALARVEAKALVDRVLRDFIVQPAGEARRRESQDWNDFECLPVKFERGPAQ